MTTTPDEDVPRPSPPTLSYAGTDLGGGPGANLVTIAKCVNATEAAMRISALEAEGITASIVNENFGSLGYGAVASVEVQVRQDEADRAAEVLRVALSDEVEPADDQPETMPALEPEAAPIPLETVGRFDNIRALREAALLLESARIRSVPPKLIPREGPAGTGDRFHLRVASDDADRAKEVLADLDEDIDDEEHRCPKCSSWRVYPVGQFVPLVRWILRMGDKPLAEMDCLECKYRGPKEAFERKS